jgi:hypothetical protein
MIYHLEGSLASSVHTGGLRHADIFLLPPAPCSVGGMDLGCEGDVVRVHLRPQLHRTSEGDISYALEARLW